MATSAFIRLYNKELIDYIRAIGYEGDEPVYGFTDCGIATAVLPDCKRFTIIREDIFDHYNPRISWNVNGRIDCGTNIEKFKSLL